MRKQNIMFLEHVNLNVESNEVAVEFYVKGLGMTINPRGYSKTKKGELRQVHFNAGLSQFHCAWIDGDGSKLKKNVFSGDIWLWVLSLSNTLASLRNNKFCVIETADESKVVVVGPYGNRFVLNEAPEGFDKELLELGEQPGGCGTCVGISKVVHYVEPGTAHGIGRFYRQVLEANAEARCVAGEYGLCCCTVFIQHGFLKQEIVFQEAHDAVTRNSYSRVPFKDFHIAVYVNDLREAYRNCEKLGIIWLNPRFTGFPLFDTANTLGKALEKSQFRIKDIVDPRTKKLLLEFEHEIRALTHPSCPLNVGKARQLNTDIPNFDDVSRARL